MDEQTDGRTDRIAISISRVSVLTRDKNAVFFRHDVYIHSGRVLLLCHSLHIFFWLTCVCISLWQINNITLKRHNFRHETLNINSNATRQRLYTSGTGSVFIYSADVT